MTRAFRCETCDGDPTWRITRRGDAVVSWACNPHLAAVCDAMQRDWEITELVVVHVVKLREWNEIAASLDAATRPTGMTGADT